MIAWTTPTKPLLIKGADLTGCKVTVDIEQGCTIVSVIDPPMSYTAGEGTTLMPTLTQEQTGSLRPGPAKLQVNAITQAGYRAATKKVSVSVGDNIRKEPMAYGD